jgi:hypothetical protein
MRFREIQGLDYTDSLDTLFNDGLLVSTSTHNEFLEIFGMTEMIATCRKILDDRGAMSQFYTTVGRAIYERREGMICKVAYGMDIAPVEEQEILNGTLVSPFILPGTSTLTDVPHRVDDIG